MMNDTDTDTDDEGLLIICTRAPPESGAAPAEAAPPARLYRRRCSRRHSCRRDRRRVVHRPHRSRLKFG